jgi:hypothetical protein
MADQKIRIPSTDVPEEIINGELGKYPLDKTQYVIKDIDITDGWRYCIGIKDISTYSHKFADKSEMITKPFTTNKPIISVSLYSNEVIPEIFLQDLTSANDWIQYFISIDDINWYKISPSHHQPITGSTDFPPKVYKINSKGAVEDKVENPLNGYIYTDNDVYSIRLKIILRRPTNISNADGYTPILEDYSLRVVMEDNFLEGGLL